MSLEFVSEVKRTFIRFNRANASGYGGKITTQYMIKVYDENIWRRVYASCWANASSFWIMYKGEKVSANSSCFLEVP